MQAQNLGKLLDELTRDEGYRRKVYKDSVGIETVGIGRNLVDVGISMEEARMLLRNDVKEAVSHAEKFHWYSGLSSPRKRVIINMIFNIGITRFKKFKKTIQYISVGDFSSASVEMLDSKWAEQVGVRATRLSVMMKKG
jgi:lysozyme